MNHKSTQELVRLAGIACCSVRSAATTRAVAVDRRATGSLASADPNRATKTLRAARPAVAGCPGGVRRLPGTITGKAGVRHLAGTVFACASM